MTNNNLYKKQCILFNSLFERNNIHDIISSAENILKNPIFLLDTSYHIISRSPLAEKINSSMEIHNGDYYLIENLIELMKKNKCIDFLYSENKSFYFKDENNMQELIFCPIKINNLTVFYICILKTTTNFTNEHLELTNTLSKVLAIQIERDNIFISNSGFNHEYCLTDLLSNKIGSIQHLQKRLNNISFKPSEYFIVLAIPFKQHSNNYNLNFATKELFRNIKNILESCIFTYYKNKVVFLVTNKDNSVISKSEYFRLTKFLKLNKLRCGISIPFKNILDTPDFFEQAVFASSLNSEKNIIFFSDYTHTYLFTNNNRKIKLSTLIHPYIKVLQAYDKKHHTELTKTLKVYLENNRNVNSASSLLNIHKSTFFYRFHRIENITSSSLQCSNMLFKLELSFKILEYIKSL